MYIRKHSMQHPNNKRIHIWENLKDKNNKWGMGQSIKKLYKDDDHVFSHQWL